MTPPGGHPSPFSRRRAGILLHPTSLPDAGAGALGPHAYYFIDFLQSTGQSIWQVLPLGPTHEDLSPYNSLSAHAGNPALISLDLACQWGWLDRRPHFHGDRHDPARHAQLLEEIGAGFDAAANEEDAARFEQFAGLNGEWLDEFALYRALRDEQGGPWTLWPEPLRDRHPPALAAARARLKDRIHRIRVIQFAFHRQWQALKVYANSHGVLLFGDLPIFVAHDSADVWAQREYFRLEADGSPAVVAGVPPDRYSAAGQHWGNPLYDWERMAADGYRWWLARLRTQLNLFDLVRIDHFRGFDACWELPGDARTAAHGRWIKTPGDALFRALTESLGRLPVVAEDLGMITAEVEALRRRYGFPGMKVLQFAFDGGPENPYLPHQHVPDAVVYTGTHDNDTTRSWFESLPEETRQYVLAYTGYADEPMPWALIRSALASVCRVCILPMQDVLGLGAGHRMNTPGRLEGSWRWSFDWSLVTPEVAARLRYLTRLYGRA